MDTASISTLDCYVISLFLLPIGRSQSVTTQDSRNRSSLEYLEIEIEVRTPDAQYMIRYSRGSIEDRLNVSLDCDDCTLRTVHNLASSFAHHGVVQVVIVSTRVLRIIKNDHFQTQSILHLRHIILL